MNTRCYRCGWNFTMSREAMAAAVANAAASGEKYHAELCPRCRQTLKIPVDQLQRALGPSAMVAAPVPTPAAVKPAPPAAGAPASSAAPAAGPRPVPAPPPEPASPAKHKHHKRGAKAAPVARPVATKTAAKKPAARPSPAKKPAARKPAAKTATRQTISPKKGRHS